MNFFLNDLKKTNDLLTNDPKESDCFITDAFIKIFEPHAPLEKRFFRENQAPVMKKELRKAVYTRSRLRNNFSKNPTKKNEPQHKIQQNKCASFRNKVLRIILRIFPKLALLQINFFDSITDSSVLVVIRNSNYINIFEKTLFRS